MTDFYAQDDFMLYERRPIRKLLSQAVSGPVCLTACIVLSAWVLYARLADDTPPPASAATVETVAVAEVPVGANNPYGAILDPGFSLGATPSTMADNAPLASGFTVPLGLRSALPEPEKVVSVPVAVPPTEPQLLQDIPLPARRPADLLAQSENPRQSAQLSKSVPMNPAAPQADDRSFFEKIFGMKQSSGQVLAYAAPEDGQVRTSPAILGKPPVATGYDRYTAVYDITARVVYMPNGSRLEAHSGLGERLDDPRYVNERMRGATPPHLYDLTLRESLFHGVQALRLNPVGEGDVFGRSGLLVHRYMLGPNGDSNGCVSVRDYEAFLQAYRNGEIKRLAVVARLN